MLMEFAFVPEVCERVSRAGSLGWLGRCLYWADICNEKLCYRGVAKQFQIIA